MNRSWNPGWVLSLFNTLVRIDVGQVWAYFDKDVDIGPGSTYEGILPLRVVSTSPSGEVVLRCPQPGLVDQMFPLKETLFKGKTIMSRDCPFMIVDDRMAKVSNGSLQVGDLLANKAWTVWQCMHKHTAPPKPGDFPFRVEKV